MIIRAATSGDLAALATIQAASREASAWEPSTYLDYECQVAIVDARVVGFLVFRRLTPGDAGGEYEILNLAVEPAERRRGVARLLVESALRRNAPVGSAPGDARDAWYLEVRESNSAAIRFYESLGFEAAGRREQYYRDPPEAAIVMRFFS